MKLKILGIANITELDSFADHLDIRIHLKYPIYSDLLCLEPKERIKVIRQRKRENFKTLVKFFNKRKYKRIGSKIAPDGLEINCSKKELIQLNKEERIEHISILINTKTSATTPAPIASFFAVKTRFAIQIENRQRGLQTYEDRLLLIKATSGKEAEKKLKKGFKVYEKPYLNPYGELVRWKFEEFVDRYETSYSTLEDMIIDGEEGIEIFSTLKRRRLNKERIWNRNHKK